MATTTRTKVNIEFLLVKAELKGILEKGLIIGCLHEIYIGA